MFQLRELAFLLVAVSWSASAAIGPVADLVIANGYIAPDGFSRSATLAGGVFPGPMITGKKGDTFSINVVDMLTDKDLDLGTSIHWHGIFQLNKNYVDGPTFVTQCPLVPRESFKYQFDAKSQAGTFWYHSHFKNQYCDGLRGPLIIYDPDDPHSDLYDVDDESTVITLGDWYHYLSTSTSEITPSFNSTLINGKGRYPGGPQVGLAVVNVIKGKRYRFRLVSISCGPSFRFSIDNHTMTVIEVDGTNVQPLTIDGVELFAGQRYSVVVNANQQISNYWIRALPNPGLGRFNFDNSNNVAVLRYDGAPDQSPPDPSQNVPVIQNPLIETNLHPIDTPPVPGDPSPGGADVNINLEAILNDARTAFLINGTSFKSPTVPVLLQILNGKNASELLPTGSVYSLESNQSVELTIPGGALGGPHPVHLSGHSFYVVRSAGNSSYNFVDPIVRDVVSIGGTGDKVTIRFFTDNPGPWLFRCHNDWHLNAGFAVVFAEDVPDVASSVYPSDEWDNLCPAYDNFIGEST
ncbi:laccase [Russula aff. rugulosa BPL654]|nr:laccase [Russula aff. rugulosa BPL654]